MHVVPSSRPKIKAIEEKIDPFFESNRMPTQFNGDRVRFECLKYEGKALLIEGSPEKYASHFFLRTTSLPKTYQANLLSVGGVLLTKDRKLASGMRNSKNSDQGKIYNMVPGGFLDVEMKDRKTVAESPFSCGERELNEELEKLERTPLEHGGMEILGLIYNSRKNFDTSIAVLMPMEAASSEIRLKGKEFDELVFTDVSRKRLEERFYELSLRPETNSGHLRGDIGLLFAREYGVPSYKNMIARAADKLYDSGFVY